VTETLEYGLPAHARLRPDKTALVHGERSITFRALNERANRLADALATAGVGPGDRVGLMLRNSIEFFETTQGAAKLGAQIVPLNFHFRRDEIEYILDDSEAKAVVVGGDLAAEVAAIGGKRLWLAVGGAPGMRSYEEALAGASSEDRPDYVARSGYNAMIYTSGTTGRPKGVVHPRMDAEIGYQMQIRWCQAWDFRTGDVHLMVGPAYHTAPGGYAHLHLFLGATVVIMDKWDAERCLETIARHRVTTVHMVPVNFIRILELPEATRRRHDVSSLRRVLHAAAPCPEDVKWRIMKVFPEDSVWEYYGATEGPGTIISPEEWRKKPGSVGKPWPGIEVRILDEAGKRLAPGEVGLIYVSTPGGRGFEYHKAPEKTASAYREGFFTVGDMGYLDDDGYLFICDRKIDMVISGGVNIYPREIEEALHRHPKVLDCAVFGVPDDQWGEAIKAVVEPKKGERASAAELTAFCKEHLAAYKCPRSFDFVDELPRDPNGKVLKRRLRDPYWEGRKRKV
jgi:long-chain acyl-CoA synthetase